MPMDGNASFASVGSQFLQPGVPTDDELYDAGWAKAFDPSRQAYYYYRIDGSAPTTWQNPLAPATVATGYTSGLDASFGDASGFLSAMGSQAQLHMSGSIESVSTPSKDSDDSSSSSSATVDNEASFFGESQASMGSLRMAALMAGSISKMKGNASAANTSAATSVRLDASQPIPEEVEDEASFAAESSSSSSSKEGGEPREVFEDEVQYDPKTGKRKWGGTDRTVLRPPDFPENEETQPLKPAADGRPRINVQALLELRRKEYLELFEADRQRFAHRKLGAIPACIILLIALTGFGVGGYFIFRAAKNDAEAALTGTSAPTSSPTAIPIVEILPDYTLASIENPGKSVSFYSCFLAFDCL